MDGTDPVRGGVASAPAAVRTTRRNWMIPASIAQRVGSVLADGVLFVMLVAVPTVVIGWQFGPADNTSCTFVGDVETCQGASPEAILFTRIVFFTLAAVFVLLYSRYVGRGATIGKRATETMIVDVESGEPIGYGRGVLRTVLSIVSAVAFGLGFAVMLSNRRRRAAHDYVMKTIVVSP